MGRKGGSFFFFLNPQPWVKVYANLRTWNEEWHSTYEEMLCSLNLIFIPEIGMGRGWSHMSNYLNVSCIRFKDRNSTKAMMSIVTVKSDGIYYIIEFSSITELKVPPPL